jgi:putative oxidoreductase
MDWMAWGPLPLRLVVGLTFILHGSQKAFGAFGGPGMEGFSKALAGMQIPMPALFAWAVMLVELAGGIGLFFGAFTRVCAALIAVDMLVAIMKVHLPKGFFAMGGGIEYPLVLLAACVSLVIMGGGALSLTDF